MTRVTMCIVFYNHEEFVYDALEGAVNQSYENYDLIIRDDASTDRTQDLIREYFSKNEFAKGDLILDLATQNEGLIRSLNRILMLSRNEIIVSQSGDDISLPDRIRKSVAILEKYDVDLVSCDAMIINSEGSLVAESWFEQTKGPIYRLLSSTDSEQLIIRNPKDFDSYTIVLPGFGFTFRKRLFRPLEIKLPEYISYEDFYITFLALVNNGVVIINDALILYRRHTENMSKRYFSNFEEFKAWQSIWLKKKINVAIAQLQYLKTVGRGQIYNFDKKYYYSEVNILLLSYELTLFERTKVSKKMALVRKLFATREFSKRRKCRLLLMLFWPKSFSKLLYNSTKYV